MLRSKYKLLQNKCQKKDKQKWHQENGQKGCQIKRQVTTVPTQGEYSQYCIKTENGVQSLKLYKN